VSKQALFEDEAWNIDYLYRMVSPYPMMAGEWMEGGVVG